MKELNKLHCNKNTLNSAYIFFDSAKKAKELDDALNKLDINRSVFIIRKKGTIYYGFKLYRIKRDFFNICSVLEEVLNG